MLVAKWVPKVWILINKRHFVIFWDNCTYKGIKSQKTKKQILSLQLNEKKSKESQTRLMSWYWKRKSTWRKDLITYNNNPWIMFSFNWLVIIWRGGVRLKLDVQGQGSGRILGVDQQERWWSWKLNNFHRRHICIIPKMEKKITHKNVKQESENGPLGYVIENFSPRAINRIYPCSLLPTRWITVYDTPIMKMTRRNHKH